MFTFKEIEKTINKQKKPDENLFSYIASQYIKQSIFISGFESYFYDEKELKHAKSVVNIKLLNDVKKLDKTIEDFSRIPINTILCGRFIATKSNSNAFIKFKETLELLTDKTPRILTVNGVVALLNSHHFQIINITEIDGITYFNAKKYE